MMKKFSKRQIEILGIVLLLLAFPLLLLIIRVSQDTRSSASAPGQLETETGTLSSSGVTKQTDSGASGGSYVLFNKASTTPEPTISPSTAEGALIGSGVSMTSLSNTRIGYSGITHGAYRFRAEKSLAIKIARLYLEAGNCDGGYGSGDGGKYKYTILPDNGNGVPDLSATPLAIYTDSSSIGCSAKIGYLINFSNYQVLTAGNIYHFVMENIHSSPGSNYISMNAVLVQGNPPSPYHPISPDDTSAVYYRRSDNTWTYRGYHLPIFELTYTDNSHQGRAYMEISHINHGGGPSVVGHIGGDYVVRERFTYVGSSKAISNANIRVGKISGSGDITLKIKQGSSTLAQTSISGSVIPTIATDNLGIGSLWFGGAFSPITLENGNSYIFELSSSSGSDYRMWPIRMGKSWGYTSDAYFNGTLEYSADGGSTWLPLGGNSSGQNPGQYDLQFYLN